MMTLVQTHIPKNLKIYNEDSIDSLDMKQQLRAHEKIKSFQIPKTDIDK